MLCRHLALFVLLGVNLVAGKCPWNENDKLEPPSGGWRGAVVDDSRFSSVSAWEDAHGFPLQLKRVLKGNNWQNLTADELNFVTKHGGIIMYTRIMPIGIIMPIPRYNVHSMKLLGTQSRSHHRQSFRTSSEKQEPGASSSFLMLSLH